MIVKIVADGTARGTKVLNEDGKPLQFITGVRFAHSAGSEPLVEVDLLLVPVTVDGVAKMFGPDRREIKRIEYVDGTVDDFS